MSSPARGPAAPRTSASRTREHRTGVVRAGNLRAPAPSPATGPGTGPRPTARPASSRPDLWLVPDRAAGRAARARRTRRAPFVLLVVGMLVGTTLGLLFLNTAIAVDSLKATSLRTENARREQDVQRLERQVVDGSTAAGLAATASAAGMVPAAPPGYLVLEDGGASTVRGTPQPATPPPPATPTPGAGG
jgi:hypothetical protein